MKKAFLPLLALLFLFSCKEKGNTGVDFSGAQASDTTYTAAAETAQARNVLIEEATGVACTNCPKGAALIQSLEGTYPNRIVPVSLHAGALTAPLAISSKDFRSQAALDLLNSYFSEDPSKPSAAIDRIKTGTSFWQDRNLWAVSVDNRIAAAAPANLTVTSTWDDAAKQAVIKVRAAFTQEVTQQMALTVLLTESNLVDPQEDGVDIDTFYTHNHVLRELLTPLAGASILSSYSPIPAGRVYERTFLYTPNTAWNPDNCEVVAFINRNESSDKEVAQAAMTKLK